MKTFCLAALTCVTFAVPAVANDYIEFPREYAAQAIPRSYLSGRAVVIPPYRHVFPVRIYTTPPQQPYYNVPPYRVITPY